MHLFNMFKHRFKTDLSWDKLVGRLLLFARSRIIRSRGYISSRFLSRIIILEFRTSSDVSEFLVVFGGHCFLLPLFFSANYLLVRLADETIICPRLCGAVWSMQVVLVDEHSLYTHSHTHIRVHPH